MHTNDQPDLKFELFSILDNLLGSWIEKNPNSEIFSHIKSSSCDDSFYEWVDAWVESTGDSYSSASAQLMNACNLFVESKQLV
jgi:hypothetical protein